MHTTEQIDAYTRLEYDDSGNVTEVKHTCPYCKGSWTSPRLIDFIKALLRLPAERK